MSRFELDSVSKYEMGRRTASRCRRSQAGEFGLLGLVVVGCSEMLDIDRLFEQRRVGSRMKLN